MVNATGGKLPGKTKFSGRRRSTTRSAGFHSHPESTGGAIKSSLEPSFRVAAGKKACIEFSIPAHKAGNIVAFGGWYCAPAKVQVTVAGAPFARQTLTPPSAPNWSKFGSMWTSADGRPFNVIVTFHATATADIALHDVGCGIVKHKHLDDARSELLTNMYQFSPEAHFYAKSGDVKKTIPAAKGTSVRLYRKACNRCARFLPVNIQNELIHLSFSNHCKAEHRRPCSHTGFGKLTDVDTGDKIQLEYGYQLECRFCKKFEVNAAHNPQRTAAQMKEDGARRRALELLLTELLGGSPQLKYRYATGGRELADDIWNKFDRKCFNCGIALKSPRTMHLDHTRPLALLWPLDGTATCLCGLCNSEKRDRPPATFYRKLGQLRALATITGIPLADLKNPTPNLHAIRLLRSRLRWFFSDFCSRPELTKERDGKVAVELLLKALQKTLNKCPRGAPFDLQAELERLRCDN